MKDPTIHLPQALTAWGTPEFVAVLKAELEQLDPALLPLQQGLSKGSYVSDLPFQVMVFVVSEVGEAIHATAGIQYQSVIAGCSCADDPTPLDELAEYCEVEIELDKASAAAQMVLLDGYK